MHIHPLLAMGAVTGMPQGPQKDTARSMTGFLATLKLALSSPSVPLAAATLALVLSFPSVRLGFMWDDFIHRAVMASAGDSSRFVQNPWHPAGEPATLKSTVLRLFRLADPGMNARMKDLGVVPWWTFDGLRIAHFRPLSALTHWWDLVFWGDQPVPMHLENILLYVMACLLAGTLYRRMSTPLWVAGLAAVMFAVDDRHIIPVAWIANRNGLLALVFGLLAIISHDRWRRENWKGGAVLGPLFLALSMASGELGLATGAYILGHAIFLDNAVWRKRALVLLPYAAIGAAWFLVYHSMDYGAIGTGLYVDPLREPVRFLETLIRQGPVMLLGQIGAVDPLPFFLISAPARVMFWMSAVVFLLLVGSLFWRMMKNDRVAGFWTMGMALSAMLVSGINVTTGRPLLFAGVGAMPLIAQFIWKTVDGRGPLLMRTIWGNMAGVICLWFVVLHLLFSPLHFAVRSLTQPPRLLELAPMLNLSAVNVTQQQDLIVVNPPNTFAFLYASSVRTFLDQPVPAHVRILSPGATSVTVTRLDPSTVIVRPSGGYLIPPGSTLGDPERSLPLIHPAYYYQHFDETFRIRACSMKLHERVEVAGMSVEVVALTGDGRPSEARIRFAGGVESPRLNWVKWDWDQRAFVPFSVPAIGASAVLPGPPAEMSVGLGLFDGI